MTEHDLQPYVTLPDAAQAIGIPRAHLDTLKTITRHKFETRMDDKSIRKNRKLYPLAQFRAWLVYHLGGLSDVQNERLEAVGRIIAPSLREGATA